jgi:hypothetical protein
MSAARKSIAALMAVLLLGATVLVSSHGHLDDRDHATSCAACNLAEARSITVQPIAPPPAPLAVELAPIHPPRAEVAHGRPPLEAAPKHGPPGVVVPA